MGFGLVVALLQSAAPTAHASPGRKNASSASFRDEKGTQRLDWHWRTVHWGELVATANLAVGAIVTSQIADPPPRWTRVTGFDRWFQDRLAVDAAAQRRTDRASDAFELTLIAFPLVVDSLGVALIADKNPHVAGQLLAVQAQAFATTGFLTSVTKAVAGRQRPDARALRCDDAHMDCSRGANQSYFSGHTSYAFTGAGLTCVAHSYLGLFGRVGDPLTCAAALSLASATALFRVTANKHWMTDVLTGAGIGLFSGWLMPWLLHFRHDTAVGRKGHTTRRTLRFVAPFGTREAIGMTFGGAF
jgi:membrane-associated phospholipid phosphatase